VAPGQTHLPIALAGGWLIFIIIVVALFVFVGFSYYTRAGSGIEKHPHGGERGAPGAQGSGEFSGHDESEGPPYDQGAR